MKKFNTPFEGAAYMLAKGYKVFPLVINGKTPAFAKWQEWATTSDPKGIEVWGLANPKNNWGVYCGPSGLCVLDVDTKNGVDGNASLQAKPAFPETLKVQTPSGGSHFYFVGKTKSTAGKLGKGLDTKSEGGYVVAPGSVIDGKAYELLTDTAPIPLPDWIAEGAKAYESDKIDPLKPETLIIESGSRNDILWRRLAHARAGGFSDGAIDSAAYSLNAELCNPMLPDWEVRNIIKSVLKKPMGELQAIAGFGAPPPEQVAPGIINANSLCDIDESRIQKRRWIMQDLFLGGFISVFVAPGGVGKSTLAMLAACAVAKGDNSLLGFDVIEKGNFWLHNTEDPDDELQRRFVAIAKHHKLSLKDIGQSMFSSGQELLLKLVKDDGKKAIVDENILKTIINTIKTREIKLFIVDPFVNIHDVNENDNSKINMVMDCFRRIARETKCAILLVHHTRKFTKGDSSGDINTSRGASSLGDAARIAYTVLPMSESDAEKYGINEDDRPWYMRLDNAKANMRPPRCKADWFKKVNVILSNDDGVGTLERVTLVDVKAEKDAETFEADQNDLAEYLHRCLEIGQSIPVVDVCESLISREDYSHLFGGAGSLKTAKRKVMRLLEDEIAWKSKAFFLAANGEGNGKRTRIFCKGNNHAIMD